MTKIDYLSKNCMQCAKDLDECYGLILEIQNMVHEVVRDSAITHKFTENGVAFLWSDDLPSRFPPRVVASVFVSEYSDSMNEGLQVNIGEYTRFIHRCDLDESTLQEVFDQIREALGARYPQAFSSINRSFTISIGPNPYLAAIILVSALCICAIFIFIFSFLMP